MASSYDTKERAEKEMKSLDQAIEKLETQKHETKALLDTMRNGLRQFKDKRRALKQQGVTDWTDERVDTLNKEQDEMSERAGRAEELLIEIMDQIERKKERRSLVELDIRYYQHTGRT
jgi:predicted  nucleic acid-binding Zn-ribbon protein